MKKVILAMTALAVMLSFSACDKDHDSDDHQGSQTAPNIEARAQALGFDSVTEYETFVNEQCHLGNHQNCDIYNDGTHQPCCYADHGGQKHDGSHHNGTDYGQHGENGHHHNGQHH